MESASILTDLLKQQLGQAWLPQSELTFEGHVNLDHATDSLIYGTLVSRVSSWGNLSARMFLLLPDNKAILQWVSGEKSPADSRVNLSKVTRVFFGP